MQQHPGRLITEYTFSELFAKAWMKADTPANVIAGFQKAGIYPFNPNATKLLTGDGPAETASTPIGGHESASVTPHAPIPVVNEVPMSASNTLSCDSNSHSDPAS